MPGHVFTPPMLDDSLPIVATHFSIVVHSYPTNSLKPERHAFALTVVIQVSDVNRLPFDCQSACLTHHTGECRLRKSRYTFVCHSR